MTTAATNLRTIALHWRNLHDALGQPAIHHGFGVGLRSHLVALEEADTTLVVVDHTQTLTTIRDATGRVTGYLCQHCGDVDPGHTHPIGDERDPAQIGQRPVPVRLHILDTMRAVEAALTACADDIARTAQRAPISVPAARKADYRTLREARIAATDRQRRTELAHADQHDPRRWRYTGTRTATYAALWLLARIERAPGPCRRITDEEETRIGNVAAGAAERVERALDIAAQRRTLEQLHDCGGAIDVHGGEGRSPLAHCTGCGRIWAEGVIAA
ncbi:hypothetical protein [Streptomyces bobili]|uniref:hypothetical protein n=1 Tax=Streptomyces bobili TaxID=67280 RepID=UPI000A3A9856|nr:hypothetical protein [Streptomyces bobili]